MYHGTATVENSMADSSTKKLNIELPYDLAIPFLDVYPKELKARTGTDISMLMSTATLFTVSKT